MSITFATESVHCLLIRNGSKSLTSALPLQCLINAGIAFPGAPVRVKNGIFFACRFCSTSRRPCSIKLYCRVVALRNSGTRQKSTKRGTLFCIASFCAKINAQLSFTLWSRLIQRTTGPDFRVPSLIVLTRFWFTDE